MGHYFLDIQYVPVFAHLQIYSKEKLQNFKVRFISVPLSLIFHLYLQVLLLAHLYIYCNISMLYLQYLLSIVSYYIKWVTTSWTQSKSLFLRIFRSIRRKNNNISTLSLYNFVLSFFISLYLQQYIYVISISKVNMSNYIQWKKIYQKVKITVCQHEVHLNQDGKSTCQLQTPLLKRNHHDFLLFCSDDIACSRSLVLFYCTVGPRISDPFYIVI